MLFRRFYEDSLAQASYLIGCQATGEAVVIDANRDADLYLRAAAAEGVRITHVTETHIHADYLSGSRELMHRTGAQLLLSAYGGDDWGYRFGAGEGATLLHDGEEFSVGNIRLRVLHTPGHTPEHISFVVTDGATTEEPLGLVSGDFLFVGALGRPDLLEKAAGVEGTMEAAARQLFASLSKLEALPDHVQVWPGHGAGSACGKALGAMPSSTLGYERRVNPGLAYTDEEAFVEYILSDQPEPPRYFAVMKYANRDGPRVAGALPTPARLSGAELREQLGVQLGEGAVAVDLRSREAFAAGHVGGSINLPFGASFTNWAGSLLPYDRSLVLIGANAETSQQAARQLFLIGLDAVEGFAPADVFGQFSLDPGLESAESTDSAGAAAKVAEGMPLIDVRSATEWASGHVAEARHIHLGRLPQAIDEVPGDGPVLVMCQSGGRSAIARSILLSHGRRAINVEGGMMAWMQAGLPFTTEE